MATQRHLSRPLPTRHLGDADVPATLSLGVSFSTDLLDPAQDQSIPFYVNEQAMSGVMLDAGGLLPPHPAPTPSGSAIANLQHGIQLLDARVTSAADRVELELVWAGTEPIPGDYTVFVHLLNAAGERAAQGDASPRHGSWPTWRWRPGEPVSSYHTIALPPDLPAGEYMLAVGMYDHVTGERLAATDSVGNEWADWAVLLSPALKLPY